MTHSKKHVRSHCVWRMTSGPKTVKTWLPVHANSFRNNQYLLPPMIYIESKREKTLRMLLIGRKALASMHYTVRRVVHTNSPTLHAWSQSYLICTRTLTHARTHAHTHHISTFSLTTPLVSPPSPPPPPPPRQAHWLAGKNTVLQEHKPNSACQCIRIHQLKTE